MPDDPRELRARDLRPWEREIIELKAEIERLRAELDRARGESGRLYEKIEKLRGAGVRHDDEGGQ